MLTADMGLPPTGVLHTCTIAVFENSHVRLIAGLSRMRWLMNMRPLPHCLWCAHNKAGGDISPYEVPKEMDIFHEITRRVLPVAAASRLGWVSFVIGVFLSAC